METDFIDYNELVNDANRALGRERERITAEAEQVNAMQRVMDAAGELISKNEKLTRELVMQKAEVDALHTRLQEEKREREELEMKMAEMSKLSAGVAKKASQDDLQKALRIFLNTSKRKTQAKREAAKTVITDMLTSAKIDVPDDILELLDHLDDEQTEAKVYIGTLNGTATGNVLQNIGTKSIGYKE